MATITRDELKKEIASILSHVDLNSRWSTSRIRQVLEEKFKVNLFSREKEIEIMILRYIHNSDNKQKSTSKDEKKTHDKNDKKHENNKKEEEEVKQPIETTKRKACGNESKEAPQDKKDPAKKTGDEKSVGWAMK